MRDLLKATMGLKRILIRTMLDAEGAKSKKNIKPLHFGMNNQWFAKKKIRLFDLHLWFY